MKNSPTHHIMTVCHKMAKSLALLTALLFAGCDSKGPPATGPTTSKEVLTSFYPLTYFAERIAGDLVPVRCPLSDDADPVYWKPGNSDIQALQSAKLILINGAGFEKWTATTVLPEDRLVDTTADFKEPFLKYENAVTHTHGPGKAHKHEGVDGHTWMDPMNALQQANAVQQALAKAFPDHADTFAKNFDALATDLRALDASFKAYKPPAVLYAEHPAYSYLARRYGWTLEHIDVAHPPTDKTGLLLWEGEPSATIPGLTNLVFSPCESTPESGDYLSVMRANLNRLQR